ncbi:Hypothetical protein PHPALM_10847, partial [Phytophthora palmivora]
MGKINNKKATLLFDSGAEVSILDATFARKVGYQIDKSQTLECEGVRRSPYKIEGRTRLKITLAGSLVYFFDAWVGPPTGGQDLILGMDFMVPAGIRLDLADGTICLPDEVRLQMAGRRPLYGDKIEHVCWKDHYWIDVGQTAEIRLRGQTSSQYKLLVTRGDRWVPTITVEDTLSTGSRRYAEWQNLAYQATTDEISEVDINEQITEPAAILEVCIKEEGSLLAEDVEDQMAVLPEVTVTTEEVKIENLQIGDAEINTQEEIERLMRIIWKRKHLLIGK